MQLREDLGDVTDHPATFSDEALDLITAILVRYKPSGDLRVLDPFAGVGSIHKIAQRITRIDRSMVLGVELEPEWARQHPNTHVGSALDIPVPLGNFEAIVTSVCYGNRMADHHEAKDDSKRHTYRHYLGRMPSEGSAAVMQWGQEYRDWHIGWLRYVHTRLKLRGLLIVDIKDHIRGGKLQGVVEWWAGAAALNGFDFIADVPYHAPGQRHGANGDARADMAHLLVFSLRVDGTRGDPLSSDHDNHSDIS